MNYFVILLIVVIVVIYICGFMEKKEKFVSGYDSIYSTNEPVNYSTRRQNCDELTYSPKECSVDTVIPSNNTVCSKSLSPITNNQIDNAKKKNKKCKNPTVRLQYDFDLLSSFNNAQINNNLEEKDELIEINELKSLDELKTDVRSLNSIENDIMSNY